MVNVTFLKWLFQLIYKMVKTNDYLWVTITQKNIVTSDSNYNHFFFGCCNWSVFTVQACFRKQIHLPRTDRKFAHDFRNKLCIFPCNNCIKFGIPDTTYFEDSKYKLKKNHLPEVLDRSHL